jgi:hypothetical protein
MPNYSFQEARKLEKAIRPTLRTVELLQLGAYGTSYVQSPTLKLDTNKGRLGEKFLRNLLSATKDRQTGHDMVLPGVGETRESKVRVLAQVGADSAYTATVNEGDISRCTANHLAILAYVPPLDRLELFVYSKKDLEGRRNLTIRYSTADNEFTEKGGSGNRVPLPEDLTSIVSNPVEETLRKLTPEQLQDLIRALT